MVTSNKILLNLYILSLDFISTSDMCYRQFAARALRRLYIIMFLLRVQSLLKSSHLQCFSWMSSRQLNILCTLCYILLYKRRNTLKTGTYAHTSRNLVAPQRYQYQIGLHIGLLSYTLTSGDSVAPECYRFSFRLLVP